MRTLLLSLILLFAGGLVSGFSPDSLRDLEDRAERGDRRALSMLRDSAQVGSARAAGFLGYLYWQGRGVEQRRDSGLYFIGRAARAGDVKSAANLGFLYMRGEGIPADTSAAVKWLDVAASAGQPSALRQLNDFFDLSKPGTASVLGSIKEAPHAVAVVAFHISSGKRLGYDHDRSLTLFLEAARHGDPSAAFMIAEYLEFFPDALPLKEEERDAAYWYDKARAEGVTDAVTARRLLSKPFKIQGKFDN